MFLADNEKRDVATLHLISIMYMRKGNQCLQVLQLRNLQFLT